MIGVGNQRALRYALREMENASHDWVYTKVGNVRRGVIRIQRILLHKINMSLIIKK